MVKVLRTSRSKKAKGYRHLYKTGKWLWIHDRRLSDEPLCRMCKREQRYTAATVVDHIKPHKGLEALFYDYANTQSLCKPCHDRVKQGIEARGYDKAVALNGWPIDEQHPIYKHQRTH